MEERTEEAGTIITRDKTAPNQDDINTFIIQRGENYDLLIDKFDNTDNWNECLLYTLIAANKFHVLGANHYLTWIFSDCFQKPDIGKHSLNIALHFLDRAEDLDSMSKVKLCKYLKGLERKGDSLSVINKRGYMTAIKMTKKEVCEGNCTSYDTLKKELYDINEEERLLYYAYLMADRYDYAPARQDIMNIIADAFKKYGLGNIDDDTQFFIDNATYE